MKNRKPRQSSEPVSYSRASRMGKLLSVAILMLAVGIGAPIFGIVEQGGNAASVEAHVPIEVTPETNPASVEGRPIRLHGILQAQEPLVDPDFGLPIPAVAYSRQVLMCDSNRPSGWIQMDKVNMERKKGQADAFPQGAWRSIRVSPKDIRIGNFRIHDELRASLQPGIKMTIDSTGLSLIQKRAPKARLHPEGIYIGTNPDIPTNGDLLITYFINPANTTHTVLGVSKKGNIHVYKYIEHLGGYPRKIGAILEGDVPLETASPEIMKEWDRVRNRDLPIYLLFIMLCSALFGTGILFYVISYYTAGSAEVAATRKGWIPASIFVGLGMFFVSHGLFQIVIDSEVIGAMVLMLGLLLIGGWIGWRYTKRIAISKNEERLE